MTQSKADLNALALEAQKLLSRSPNVTAMNNWGIEVHVLLSKVSALTAATPPSEEADTYDPMEIARENAEDICDSFFEEWPQFDEEEARGHLFKLACDAIWCALRSTEGETPIELHASAGPVTDEVRKLRATLCWALDRLSVDFRMTKSEQSRTAEEIGKTLKGEPSDVINYQADEWLPSYPFSPPRAKASAPEREGER